MSMQFPDLPRQGATPTAITADDILALRRSIWQDGKIAPAEAESLLAMNATIAAPGREWIDFFVEALSVWLVDQQDPRGYVDGPQADWLIERLPRAGAAEIELLVHVLEKALSAPDHLRRFALDQVEKSVIEGDRCVTAQEAALLRRLIFASGGDGPASVAQSEAEALFRIKDACLAADNAPEWQRLFAQGVGNYLQGCPNFAATSREREQQLETFMNSPEPGLFGFMRRMGHHAPAPSADDLRAEHIGVDPDQAISFAGHKFNLESDAELLGHDLEAAARTAAAIDGNEQSWLDGHIQADGTVDRYEQALLDFLAAA